MSDVRCTCCFGAETFFNCVCENDEGVFLCKDSPGCGHTLCQCGTEEYEESVGC